MNEPIQKKTMRDVFIERIYEKMRRDKKIFFLSADFGAPALDKIRAKFPDRFINVGIAEQNLINIATGLALEGFTVYAYAISAFLAMRAYEQIRVNLSLFSQLKRLNVNLVGVGAGISYDVAGPTHHCLEDLSIIRTLPNIIVFSPSDWVLVEKFLDLSVELKSPKYFRFDSKALPAIYKKDNRINLLDGFTELARGKDICLVATGYMTQISLKIAKILHNKKIGIVDIFLLRPLNEKRLYNILKKYKAVITLEEAFIDKGGLDCVIANFLNRRNANIILKKIGFREKYLFSTGSRDYLHALGGCGEKDIIKTIKEIKL